MSSLQATYVILAVVTPVWHFLVTAEVSNWNLSCWVQHRTIQLHWIHLIYIF